MVKYADKSNVETYTYDAESVRRSKKNATEELVFISDTTGSLSMLLAETDSKGNHIASYTRADTLISQTRGDKTSTYLYDGHGDVRALLNEAGRITDKYRYTAYGDLIEQTGDTENHFRYTGEYYDGVSDLYYLRARYMSTETGTFISMDTYEGSIYDPYSLHKYLYANGNPVKYNDPSGNFFSAVGMVVATTINTIINNHEEIHAMAMISGVTSSIIAKALGESDEEVAEAFFKGYFTGGILGSVMYVVAAYEIMSIAEMCMLMASQSFVVNVVMTIAAINSDNKRHAVVYGTLAVLSLATFCELYKINGEANLIGDRDSRTFKFDNSNPEVNNGRTFESKYEIPKNDNGYTKSNLKLGQAVHKEYKAGEVDNISKFKEYTLPSGKRVDFIDFENKIVYELKPYNPRQIKNGTKQLENYLIEIEEVFGDGWTTVLDTY